MVAYAYPADLTQFVSKRWDLELASKESPAALAGTGSNPLVLGKIISVCYQASLLREEQRPVTFRIICCEPESFPPDRNPPAGFHILPFSHPRQFTPRELRALSQSAGFYRSLIGIRPNENGELEIWGIVHSGPGWLRELHGGRRGSVKLPRSVVIRVNRSGYLEVCQGSVLVGQLRDGLILDASMNMFDCLWIAELFSSVGKEVLSIHEGARGERGREWSTLDPTLGSMLGQQMLKRIIATIQASHHGGMLLIVSPEKTDPLLNSGDYLRVKYKFDAMEARARYQTLILSILEKLVKTNMPKHTANASIGWKEFSTSTDHELLALDEGLFELSHLVAGLGAIDGAVVLTKRFEILSFGAEITCHSANVSQVAHAFDIEGDETKIEKVGEFGTRHRAAYRFVSAVPHSLAIVISQDGAVQFISERNSVVTYWNHDASMQISIS